MKVSSQLTSLYVALLCIWCACSFFSGVHEEGSQTQSALRGSSSSSSAAAVSGEEPLRPLFSVFLGTACHLRLCACLHVYCLVAAVLSR